MHFKRVLHYSRLTQFHFNIVVIEEMIIATTPNAETTPLPIIRRLLKVFLPKRLCIKGGTQNARGQPRTLPIRLTTLSKSFIVVTAMMERTITINVDMTFRVSPQSEPFFVSILSAVRQIISSEGKFCNGNVNTTARLYASCTVVAIVPGGRLRREKVEMRQLQVALKRAMKSYLVVMTVLTLSPNATQHVRPKKV